LVGGGRFDLTLKQKRALKRFPIIEQKEFGADFLETPTATSTVQAAISKAKPEPDPLVCPPPLALAERHDGLVRRIFDSGAKRQIEHESKFGPPLSRLEAHDSLPELCISSSPETGGRVAQVIRGENHAFPIVKEEREVVE